MKIVFTPTSFVCELFPIIIISFQNEFPTPCEWRHHVGKSGQVLCGSMLPNFIWCTWVPFHNGKASQGKILWMFEQSKLLIFRGREGKAWNLFILMERSGRYVWINLFVISSAQTNTEKYARRCSADLHQFVRTCSLLDSRFRKKH